MAYDHRPSPKQPPQSVDAECAVLGGLMVWNAAWHPVSAIVTEADFYTADHREVFAAIAALCKAGRAADAVSVGSYLRDRHGRELASYAMTLAADTASACSAGPETMPPFGMLKRSPSSSAVPPMMTFLSFSWSSAALLPFRTSTKDTRGMVSCWIEKSMRNGPRFSSYCPAMTAPMDGRNSPSSFWPKG